MKQQDYQYTLTINQLFCHILPYLKLFGSKPAATYLLKKEQFFLLSVCELLLLIKITRDAGMVLEQIYIS
jgi:hypothetical protein